jgi:hypothetical protein
MWETSLSIFSTNWLNLERSFISLKFKFSTNHFFCNIYLSKNDLTSFTKSIVLNISDAKAESQAEAPWSTKFALMPMSSGIPTNTYCASQVLKKWLDLCL